MVVQLLSAINYFSQTGLHQNLLSSLNSYSTLSLAAALQSSKSFDGNTRDNDSEANFILQVLIRVLLHHVFQHKRLLLLECFQIFIKLVLRVFFVSNV